MLLLPILADRYLLFAASSSSKPIICSATSIARLSAKVVRKASALGSSSSSDDFHDEERLD
jgi:hypothetical protein